MIYVMSDIHGNRKAFDDVMNQINLNADDEIPGKDGVVMGNEEIIERLNELENLIQDCSTAAYLCCPLYLIRKHKGPAIKRIRELEALLPKWISVEERLPEEGKNVLVSVERSIGISNIICHDMLTSEPIWAYTGLGADPEYWMPLPTLPKEEDTYE